MTRLRQDFQAGTVTDAPLTDSATTVNSAEFADLMAVTGSDVLVLVLDPRGDDGDPEIVHVTAHTASATSATVSRGEEGTTAREHAAGTVWEHSPTAEDFTTTFGLKSITFINPGTTTYNLPAGIADILVQCIGGGGGGGGAATAASSGSAGGGGGGGGYAETFISSPAASYDVAVGAGGAGGAAGNNTGSAGGTTSFGAPSVCTATGGSGGLGAIASTIPHSSGGTAGGTGTVGNLLLAGGDGMTGLLLSVTVAIPGFGGTAARGGSGPRGRTSTGDGLAASTFGGGGSGGNVENGSAAAAGGAGADGLIVVYEYGP